MYSKYPLFQSHIDLAHHYWKQLVEADDCVIDATCGNGKDTLILVKLALKDNKGKVFAYDSQLQAIESARHYLQENLSSSQINRIAFMLHCHSQFDSAIAPETVKLIVYNLGYLPGGDKSKTTTASTTIESLSNAVHLILPGGAISITCYPGHIEGASEEKEVLSFISALPPQMWNCCYHQWPNRAKSPSLILLQKTKN